MRSMLKYSGVVVLIVASATVAAAAGTAEADTYYEEDLGRATRYVVSAGSVDVTVQPADGEARVEARLHEDRELIVTHDGDTARIAVEGVVVMSFGSLNERVDLYVPPGSAITIDTGSGDLALERLEVEEIRISGGSADVSLSTIQGPVKVETASGDQTYRDVTGRLEAVASSGDIELHSVAGPVTLETSSGDISGRDVRLDGGLTITTGSGDVDLALDHAESDLTFDLRAGSGDIRVNRIRSEDDLGFGDGPITVRATSGSGDQTYRTR